MRVSVVATGIDAEEAERPKPVTLSVVSGGEKQQAQHARQATQNAAQAVAEELRQQPAGTTASGQQAAEMPAMAATGTDGGYADSREYAQPATAATAQPAYAPAEAEDPADPEAAREDAFIAPPRRRPRASRRPDRPTTRPRNVPRRRAAGRRRAPSAAARPGGSARAAACSPG